MIYCKEYLDEIKKFSKTLNKKFLQGKTLFISGATGLICSYLIDALLIDGNFDIKIVALVFNKKAEQERFSYFKNDPRLEMIDGNIVNPIVYEGHVDFIIHGAGYSDPLNFAKHPIDTMLINFNGVRNMLDFGVSKNAKKLLFLSSGEVYGESDVDSINEDYCGYINSMDVRSCYNEGKRASETLCVSYAKEKGIEVVIPRFCRLFGSTIRIDDTKALTQFIKNGIEGKDIVLKSDGAQMYSYCYVSDAVSAIMLLLEKGKNCEAYNVANPEKIQLKDFAKIVADTTHISMKYEIPNIVEKSGYSRVTRAVLDTTKIEKLGWKSAVSLKDGIQKTLSVVKAIYYSK